MFIHPLKKGEKVDLVTWGDAAWANRPDHVNSTEGLICGLAPQSLRRGELSKVTLLSWKSGKIHRKCRSPACAEVHAVVDAEDDLYHLRYLWSEMHYPRSMLEKLSAPEIVNLTPGITITDSKNLYDKINTDSPTVKGEEKRSTIEALALKDSSTESGTMLRWVHSDAQLANSLTKPSEKQQLLLFFQLNQSWRIIYDEQMKSARRRKADGIKPMENQAVDSYFFCPPVQIHDQYQSEFMFPSAQHCGPSPIVKKGVRILASSCEPLAIYIYICACVYVWFVYLCMYSDVAIQRGMPGYRSDHFLLTYLNSVRSFSFIAKKLTFTCVLLLLCSLGPSVV